MVILGWPGRIRRWALAAGWFAAVAPVAAVAAGPGLSPWGRRWAQLVPE